MTITALNPTTISSYDPNAAITRINDDLAKLKYNGSLGLTLEYGANDPKFLDNPAGLRAQRTKLEDDIRTQLAELTKYEGGLKQPTKVDLGILKKAGIAAHALSYETGTDKNYFAGQSSATGYDPKLDQGGVLAGRDNQVNDLIKQIDGVTGRVKALEQFPQLDKGQISKDQLLPNPNAISDEVVTA